MFTQLYTASFPQCNLAYTDEMGCGIWSDGGDGAPGMGSIIEGLLQMCQEVGPLFGCEKYGVLACSSVITPVAR